MNNKSWLILILFIMPFVIGNAQDTIEIHEGLHLYPSLDIKFQIKADNDIIFLGEQHGDKESKIILKQLILYMCNEYGLRDIAIEEDAAFSEHANDYINGKIDNLRTELTLRKDVLDTIKELNEYYENSMFKVHLIDVDSPKSTIDEHLSNIADNNTLNELNISGIGEEYVSIEKTFQLIERLKNMELEEDMRSELNSLEDSLYLYQHLFVVTEEKVRIPNRVSQAPIKEAVITRNIASIKESIGRKPLLVFSGGAHAMKSNQIVSINYVIPSAEQLTDLGYKVYSIFCCRLSGEYNWRGRKKEIEYDLENIVFHNGITLKTILSEYEKYKLVQIDLNQPRNVGLDLLKLGFKPGKSHLVFDEIIFIDNATPMEH